MVAARIAVDARGAAELAHPQHHGVVPQAALGEIFHERAHRLVHLGQFLVEPIKAVLVQVPAAEIDFHKGDTRFHQSSGQQATAAEAGGAVLFAHRWRLFVDLERGHLLAGEERHRFTHHFGVFFGDATLARTDEV